MERIQVTPEQVLRAGEDGEKHDVLTIYYNLHRKGYSHAIEPVYVITNEPEIIRETAQQEIRTKVVQYQKDPLAEYRKYHTIDPIVQDLDHRSYHEVPFCLRLMKNFGYKGEWDDFLRLYSAGEFHPLYTDRHQLFETSREIGQNEPLTWGGVLTRQHYEAQRREFEREQEQKISEDFALWNRRFGKKYKALKKYADEGASYLLVDGNHRAIAATLAGKPIDCFVLENDSDVASAIETAQRGGINDFHSRWSTFAQLRDELWDFYTHQAFSTVRKLVDGLISDEDFPAHLKPK